MDLKSIPRDERIYMTYRTGHAHAFTETNDLACLLKNIIQYPISNELDDTEHHGTLFIGLKRYAASDAYQVLGQIMTIACQHRGLMKVLLYDEFKPNQDLSIAQDVLLQQCDKVCKKLGIHKEDVINCLMTFDAYLAQELARK